MAAQQPYGIYRYMSYREEETTYETPNEKFGKLKYFHANTSGQSVLYIFNTMNKKRHMGFAHWGVTKQNNIFFGLFQSLTNPANVYVIYDNHVELTEETLQEISDQIENDVISSHRRMYDLRL